ncbi:unnamed protein product [Caenorhabditis sp. 36 PRJEB53466]|nr:unnamed protein product [Caenorhabditis sp. 36 PRJEB53466]
MADISLKSNQSILSRGARPESGRLHRKYPYRWLFDQVHVKSLVFHVEVALLATAIIGLYHASQMSPDGPFEPISVPGFDGLHWSGENQRGARPHQLFARNALNIFSYFLIFSVISGFLGMRLSEMSVARRKFPPHMNPASLLIPSTISVFMFMYPLSLWTLRTLHSMIRILIKENLKFSTVLDSCRLTMLPIIIIWAMYIYFLYGFWLGLLYYQRRGDQPSPTSQNSAFRRPLRKTSHQASLRFQGKGCNLLSDLGAVPNELSAASSSHCAAPSAVRHNRSISPRSFRQLETVDEEAQSRSSSD